jgi:hypothetical protein
MPAADQAQSQAADAVHAAAVQASATLNKLAQALQKAGAPQDVVKQVDDMANSANELASAAVGNPPESAPPAEAPPEQPYSPTPGESPGGLGSAVQDFQQQYAQ